MGAVWKAIMWKHLFRWMSAPISSDIYFSILITCIVMTVMKLVGWLI